MRKILLLVAISAFSIKCLTAKNPFKFGKISPTEFETNICPIDSGAEAYYLGDYGETQFNFINGGIIFERHYRMKIVNKNGYSHSTIKIKLRDNANISGLKANTYNFEDGKVVKYEMNSKNKAEERINDFMKSVNFAMPNVKEGSIIEVTYKIYFDSYWVPDWYFQTDIPNLISSYTVNMPDFFNYKKLSKGYLNVNYTTEKENRTFSGFSYTEIIEKYSCKDVPALKEEPYIDCIDNYRSCILYELASYQFPGGMFKNFNTDYASINKTLLEAESFYGQLKTILFLGSEIDSIDKNFTSKEAKMKAAYNFVQKNMKWNGYTWFLVNESIRKAYKEHNGNSCDINMLLTYMLKKLGLNAEPVVLSTRENGMLFPSQPMLYAFNYVIAQVEIDGTRYLLDATDKFCPMGMLPPRCLNNEGRQVSEKSPSWVKLNSNNSFKENRTLQLSLDSAGILKGSFKINSKEYAALEFRNNYSTFNSQNEYIKNFEENINGLTISSLKLDDLDSLSKPSTRTFELELSDYADMQGDLLYINPMLFEKMDKNPFLMEDRKFPVNYGYNYEDIYMFILTLPEGYKVEELPKSVVFAMPNNDAKFIYNINHNSNSIVCSRRRQINKTIFLQDEYKILKEFYNQMIAKEGEMIVLRKL